MPPFRPSPSPSPAAHKEGQGICIELFGIPRQRAGVSDLFLKFDHAPISLKEVIKAIASACPPLGEACFEQGRLLKEYSMNLNGHQFIREGDVEIHLGDRLLLLSADAGG